MLKHISELVVGIVTMLGSLVTIYLKHLLDVRTKEKEDVVRLTHQNDVVLYDKLEEIRVHLGADRAYIVQYHNGAYYKSGQSMLKSSMTHEVAAPGISREIAGAQNLPMSLFAESRAKFYEGKNIHVPDIDAPDIEESLRQMYLGRGIKSSYTFAIKDLKGRMMGALAVNYVTEKHLMDEDGLEYLQQNALVISGHLRSMAK